MTIETSTPKGTGATRKVLVTSDPSRKPVTVARLSDWQYLERSLHRLLAAWGRNFSEWDDKTALHRQVWEHAEAVRQIRERLAAFPGSIKNLDAPVAKSLEELGNAVLLAPSFEDALDGIYQLLTNALMKSYLDYAQAAHPVHDAPTIAMLHQIIGRQGSAAIVVSCVSAAQSAHHRRGLSGAHRSRAGKLQSAFASRFGGRK